MQLPFELQRPLDGAVEHQVGDQRDHQSECEASASGSASFFRGPVTSPGGDGFCTVLMLGIFEGSRASSIRLFSSVPWKYL